MTLSDGADQHQNALVLVFHAPLQVEAVRPDVDVAAPAEIALLPALIITPPVGLEPAQHLRRQRWRPLAHERGQRFLEVAERQPAQVENRQDRVQRPCPTGEAWQDVRGKADPVGLARGAPIAGLGPADRHRSDTRQHVALGSVAVPDQPLPAVLGFKGTSKNVAIWRRPGRIVGVGGMTGSS